MPDNTAAEPLTDERATLVAALRDRIAPLGYRVTGTPRGFGVERDLADVRWWGLLHKAGVRTLTGHEVHLEDETRTAAISDVQRNVEWRVGNNGTAQIAPFYAASGQVTRGRIAAVGTKKSWGVREDGRVGVLADYSFDTTESRQAIRDALVECGWRESMPWDQKVGLVVAAATVVLTALCFAIWGLIALLGG